MPQAVTILYGLLLNFQSLETSLAENESLIISSETMLQLASHDIKNTSISEIPHDSLLGYSFKVS